MSNVTSSNASLDEPFIDITTERSVFYGTIFMMLCYGICVHMYCHSLVLFFNFPKHLRKQYHLYVVVGTTSVILLSIAVFANVVLAQFMWIDHRNFEGGPLAYLAATTSAWWQVLGTAADMAANFIGDGLLIWRCYIIWHGNWWVITFPVLLYMGSTAMALITLVQSARPDANFFSGSTVNFGVPWVVLSVSLNVFVTVIIAGRLMAARRRLKGIMPKEALSVYTGISAILVESCLPFSVLGIVFAITYGRNLPVASAFLFIWGTVLSLAPQFIIFRVMNGRSWTTDIITQATTCNWNHTDTMHSQNQGIYLTSGSVPASKTKLNTTMSGSKNVFEMQSVTESGKTETIV